MQCEGAANENAVDDTRFSVDREMSLPQNLVMNTAPRGVVEMALAVRHLFL